MHRCLRFKPNVLYFKPQGVPMRNLEEVLLLSDEIEALKLYKIDDLDQIESSKKMHISQPTFTRIINKALKKVINAIIMGKAIKIEQSALCFGKHDK